MSLRYLKLRLCLVVVGLPLGVALRWLEPHITGTLRETLARDWQWFAIVPAVLAVCAFSVAVIARLKQFGSIKRNANDLIVLVRDLFARS